MSAKEYFTFPSAPELETHYWMQLRFISRSPLLEIDITSLQKYIRHIVNLADRTVEDCVASISKDLGKKAFKNIVTQTSIQLCLDETKNTVTVSPADE